MDRLLEKLDKIEEKIANIDVTLAKQHVSLDTHIKRTDLLEKLVNEIRKEEIAPISKHVARVEGALKFVGFLSVLIGIAAGVKSFFF